VPTIKIPSPKNTTSISATSSNVSSSINGNMELIQQQIAQKTNDYINIKNSVKILSNYSNWNGYLKLYTEVESNFEIDDIVYITYADPNIDLLRIFNLDNTYDKNSDTYLSDPFDLEFGFGYKVLYVNKYNNEVVINRYYNDVTPGFVIENQFLSKVSCRGGNYFNSIADGVTYYDCNFFNGEFGIISGITTGSGPIEGAIVLCSGLWTTTDENGLYSFTVPSGPNIIKVKAVGYITKSVTMNILKNETNILNFDLTPGANSISIGSFGNTVCFGEVVNFFSNVVGYDAPMFYQWKINNVNVGSNNSVFSYNQFNDDDRVICEIKDDFDVLFGTSTISNEIAVQIIPQSLSISRYPTGSIYFGDELTFVAVNTCFDTYTYQWRVNERVQVGTTNTFITSSLNDGDEVYCKLGSFSSNKIIVNFS
jgi:hypothetical protein